MGSVLRNILGYFIDDPFRLLTLIGGSGGAVYWWDRFKNRTKLSGRIIDETFPIAHSVLLKFEVENNGTMQTSINQKVMVTGYSLRSGKKNFEFNIGSDRIFDPENRTLAPFAPKLFSALAPNLKGDYDSLLFRTYKFSLSKGKGLIIRVRSKDLDKISLLKFYYGFMLFRFFKKNP